jgi:hypothetical protein
MDILRHTQIEVDSHLYSDDNQQRSPGLHLSQVLDRIESVMIGEKNRSGLGIDVLQACRLFGFGWEGMITRYLNERLHRFEQTVIRPGEVELDGIAMTPDGVIADYSGNPEEFALEEWKATWRSPGKGVDVDQKFARWWWQIKAYCHALQLRRANLRVFFICGRYDARPFVPLPFIEFWEVEFSELELEENWAMVLNTAKSEGWL